MKRTDFYNTLWRAESLGWSCDVDTIATRCNMTRRRFLQLCEANDFSFLPLAERMRRKINETLLVDQLINMQLIGRRLGFKTPRHYMNWHRKNYDGLSPLGLRVELTWLKQAEDDRNREEDR